MLWRFQIRCKGTTILIVPLNMSRKIMFSLFHMQSFRMDHGCNILYILSHERYCHLCPKHAFSDTRTQDCVIIPDNQEIHR